MFLAAVLIGLLYDFKEADETIYSYVEKAGLTEFPSKDYSWDCTELIRK
jgi:hypothetical protein